MADMTHPLRGDGDRSDRAQLILITGLTLAVIFVAVVLLLNTVIYTENLATRGVDAGGAEAAEFREGTATDVGELLDRTDWSTADPTAFEADLAAYAAATRDHRLRDGVVATVAGEPSAGSYVAQENASRTLAPSDAYLNETPATADEEWTLVENATRTRSYALNVTVEESIENDTVVETDAFRLRVESAADDWTLYVYRPDGGDTTVRVDGAEYTTTDDRVRLDLTNGTIDGEPWDPLVWAAGVEDPSETEDRTEYDVTYANGDTVAGSYGFVVDERAGVATASPDGPLHDGVGDSPFAVDAVYDVTVTVGHHTPELRYEDRVRVAPGERGD
ncbi:DUF7261 family protein [Halorubrum sp. DTA98]|uniref:DUF7261 family protein n=1 Tax=Halorubrum sp. DTA98 TaxID=3402163 RepID=UPI003AAA5A2D